MDLYSPYRIKTSNVLRNNSRVTEVQTIIKLGQFATKSLLYAHRRLSGGRCVGWAQCSKCPRPDGETPVPPGAEESRCPPYPVKSCPVVGAHCPPQLSCCGNIPGCSVTHDCREFLPAKCPPMSAINCSPNIPPSGWSVLGWKPSPAAHRSDPKIQMPSSPCRSGSVRKSTLNQPRRPCEARCLEETPRPPTLHYVPARPPMPSFKPFPCIPLPDVPTHMTCGGLGSDKLNGRVNFKFTFPGTQHCYSLSTIP